MLGNILAATLRNLVRNRLYAAISIIGLAVGMAAVMLTALYVRDQLTFDRYIPGYEKLYLVTTRLRLPGQEDSRIAYTPAYMAARMRLEFPGIGRIVRYYGSPAPIAQGRIEANEEVAWVDPAFFDVVPYQVIAGDLTAAMRSPDGMVLTRSMARKYFGAAAPVGQVLQLDRKVAFRVAAVVEDPPSTATLPAKIFVAGIAAASPLAQQDATQEPIGASYGANTRTFIELAGPQQAAAIERSLPAFVDRRVFPPELKVKSSFARGVSLSLTPLSEVHFLKDRFADVPSGDRSVLAALVAIAGLILLVGAINFINLMTARASRRAVEVGIRKVAGAGARHLGLQFIGESVLHALIAMLLALALVEILLPQLNALLGRRIVFTYWRDPQMLTLAAGLTLLLGAGAGIYPALVLGAFKPGEVLKGSPVRATGSAAVRRGLVTLQFAVLVGLVLSVLVVAQQTRFALEAAMGRGADQMLRIAARCVPLGTEAPRVLVERIRRLPYVVGAACSSSNAIGKGRSLMTAFRPNGAPILANTTYIDFNFLDLYGQKVLAGRAASPAYGADTRRRDPKAPAEFHSPPNVLVNAAFVRAMGLADPKAAVGQSFRIGPFVDQSDPATVIGVLPDAPFDLTQGPIQPMVYMVLPRYTDVISVRLVKDRIPDTVRAIDRIWKESGDPKPIVRQFTNEFLNTVYVNIIRQGWLIGLLAGIAVFIAGLGLFGLAAFTAERRTKEVGVRKAMGASSPDIVRLLLWSFTQPVLWANLIAWPIGGWAMSRWLEGFARHIPLSPLYFLAAGGAALLIAAVTVSAQAVRVARAKPVGALRYE